MENYYIEKMNNINKTGKVFGVFRFPKTSLSGFIFSNFLISISLEILIGFYFIFPILSIMVCYEVFRKNKIRNQILNYCLVEEIFMKEELENFGVGEFIGDPSTITNRDRDYIFYDSLSLLKTKKAII